MPMKAFTFKVTGGSPSIGGGIVVVALRRDSALRQAKRVIDVWNYGPSRSDLDKAFQPERYSLVATEPTVTEIDGATVVHAYSGEA